MTLPSPQTIYLKDYQQPDFVIRKTFLEFELFEDYTRVTATLSMSRQGQHQRPLVLHGQELELIRVSINGRDLTEEAYRVSVESLTIDSVGDEFELQTVAHLNPHANTSLEGLYCSRGMYCTQCEAEGFRKITYYLDRPDVLSEFTTKVIASKSSCPVLLSNGNCIESGEMADGRHWKIWHDPFPKPSYLFALVAGDLQFVEDYFVTQSGRTVKLQIFVEEKDLNKCAHAMKSLKHAMAWDEQVYGREYDLDVFMIVAVDDFNMGAMENKGLNIFNTSCVLANTDTTTDEGFQRVEGVVAHEYFHNWSSNRVTCRDWFQLSLKEGFTVFRDQEFSADMGSRTVKRVEDVRFLRSLQFAEDAGPMAHPVRPAFFIEISNFYTLTVYEKGAEVVRMIRTLLGEDVFRQGSDLYFDRHDGQAARVEDFIQAMADVSGRDFSQFMLWYSQAGTPLIEVGTRYDQDKQQFILELAQTCPSTPEAKAEDKAPFLIPISMSLIGSEGELELNTTAPINNGVLEFHKQQQQFIFDGIKEEPTLSLLRGFSAPVRLKWQRDARDLQRIIRFDQDGFACWDAMQALAIQAIDGINFPNNHALHALLDSARALLNNPQLDPAMVALLLTLPAESYMCEQQQVMDVDGVIVARQTVSELLAEALETELFVTYQRCRDLLLERSKEVTAESMALRSLKNKTLEYLMLLDKDLYQSICCEQFDQGENMTDTLSGLKNIVHCKFATLTSLKTKILERFYQRWRNEPLVMNHWFAVQASDPSEGTLRRVEDLLNHPSFDYKNPNKIRSVVGTFANQNMRHFHASDGSGYQFLTRQIIRLNQQNPQIAARLVAPLGKWRRMDSVRSEIMRSQLQLIKENADLSRDVFELVNKALAE